MLLYKKVSTSVMLHVNTCLFLKYFTVLKKQKQVSDITFFVLACLLLQLRNQTSISHDQPRGLVIRAPDY